MQRKRIMYLAPLDAIWPPLVLIALAAVIGLVSAWLAIKSLTALAVIGIAILIGDCFGRSKDYLNACRRFVAAGDEIDSHEVVRRFRRAWCARVACNAAWKHTRKRASKHAWKLNRYELKMPENYVSDTYFKLGYRWWHIFPDGTFTKNSPFLKIAFWVHLFTGKMKRDSVEQSKSIMEPAE